MFRPAVFVPGPPMVGRAVSVRLGFNSWCFGRLDARLLLLIICCLCRCTAVVVGCWASVVFAWPKETGRPPEGVWCTSPCFCFAGVVALPLVFPCSPSAFLFLRGSLPCSSVCRLLLLPQAHPTPPHPSACCLLPPLCFLVSPRLPAVVAPPPRVFVSRPLASCSAFFLFPLCLVVSLRRLAVCRRLLHSPPRHRACVSRLSSPCRSSSSAPPLPSRGFPPLGRLAPPFVVLWGSLPCHSFSRVPLLFSGFSVPFALAPVQLDFFLSPRLVLMRATGRSFDRRGLVC